MVSFETIMEIIRNFFLVTHSPARSASVDPAAAGIIFFGGIRHPLFAIWKFASLNFDGKSSCTMISKRFCQKMIA